MTLLGLLAPTPGSTPGEVESLLQKGWSSCGSSGLRWFRILDTVGLEALMVPVLLLSGGLCNVEKAESNADSQGL